MNTKDRTIMIIEDEIPLLQVIEKKLNLEGYETISCTSAKQALDYLRNMDSYPQLIWLDYYLTDMSGLDFMNQLKKNKNWENIPVLVVSNSASEEKKKAMLSLGVKKYLLKAQYRLEDIVKIIEEILGE